MEEMETRMAQGFTSLLVATPTVSLPHLVPRLVRYLRPGSPFVVFSQAAQVTGRSAARKHRR